VLDLVPLARPWREVAHGDAQSALIGKPLQLDLPQAATTPVRATAIGRNQYPLRLGVDLAAHVSPPPSDRLHRTLGSVMIDSHADPAGVGRFIVDAVGDDLAQHLIREVMAVDLLGLPVRVPLLAAIAVRAYEFFLLGINRYDRLPPLLEGLSPPINVLKLRIPVRMVAALERLAVGLETVAQIMEESMDRPLTDRMPLGLECRRQRGRTLACPSEQRHRVATGHRIDQSFQGLYEVWITRPQWFASPSRAA